MQSLKEKNEKYFVHIIYTGAFLLAVFAVIGYLIWSKNEAIAQEQLKKQSTLNCFARASATYTASWAAACANNAKIIQEGLSNCIDGSKRQARMMAAASNGFANYENLYQNYVSQCKTAYGDPDPKPTCTLPAPTGKSLNEGLQKDEKTCALVG